MQEQPLISVVTVSYNHGQYIDRTIKSVINQLDSTSEYIIIDGGSKDESVGIIKKYEKKLSYFISEPDGGAAEALNKGLSKAQGRYFYYLNSDDLLLPGTLEKFKNILISQPDTDVFYGHGFIQFDHDKTREKIFSDKWNLRLYQSGVVSIIQQATLFKIDILRRVGGFNESNKLNWDGELLVDVALMGASFKRVDDFFGVFRMYPGSITNQLGGVMADKARRNRARVANKIQESTGREVFSRKVAIMLKYVFDPFTAIRKIGIKRRIDVKMKAILNEAE